MPESHNFSFIIKIRFEERDRNLLGALIVIGDTWEKKINVCYPVITHYSESFAGLAKPASPWPSYLVTLRQEKGLISDIVLLDLTTIVTEQFTAYMPKQVDKFIYILKHITNLSLKDKMIREIIMEDFKVVFPEGYLTVETAFEMNPVPAEQLMTVIGMGDKSAILEEAGSEEEDAEQPSGSDAETGQNQPAEGTIAAVGEVTNLAETPGAEQEETPTPPEHEHTETETGKEKEKQQIEELQRREDQEKKQQIAGVKQRVEEERRKKEEEKNQQIAEVKQRVEEKRHKKEEAKNQVIAEVKQQVKEKRRKKEEDEKHWQEERRKKHEKKRKLAGKERKEEKREQKRKAHDRIDKIIKKEKEEQGESLERARGMALVHGPETRNARMGLDPSNGVPARNLKKNHRVVVFRSRGVKIPGEVIAVSKNETNPEYVTVKVALSDHVIVTSKIKGNTRIWVEKSLDTRDRTSSSWGAFFKIALFLIILAALAIVIAFIFTTL